jgi:hypothetical protein
MKSINIEWTIHTKGHLRRYKIFCSKEIMIMHSLEMYKLIKEQETC